MSKHLAKKSVSQIFSAAFCVYFFSQVLSAEGVRVMREIVLRHESKSVGPESARGLKLALRGLYYVSPFVRDFQNCAEVRNLFREIVGEEMIPHPSYSNVPQASFLFLTNKN